VIGRIAGTLLEKNPPQLLVDCHGVGYVLNVPMTTFYDLPAVGEKVVLLTHFVVREDAQLLYGFLTPSERETFVQLIKISGVGPRTALAVLSGISANQLAQAVAQQETGLLTKVPGIGKKTAERLLLELKGKLILAADPGASTLSGGDAQFDILNALLSLGYSEKEATHAVKQLPAELTVSAGIKQALQALGSGK
jgi:holliday junction DNA helicase RuvA